MYYKHKQLPHHGAAVILCHCPQKPFNEVIAAALEDVIAGDRVQEFMMEAEGINKSLGAKIKKFFQDICDLFKEILDVYKNVRSDSPEASIIHKMDDIYQKLQRALVKGVYDAGTNFQKAENTTGKGGVRYSLAVKSRDGTVTLEDPTKISREKIVNYLNLSRMGRLDEKSYFPVAAHTPEIIIETLKSVGIEITDKPLAMQAKKAKQSQNNHDIHSSNGYIIRGHAMSANEILEVIDKLYKPEVIIQETERTAKVKINGVTELKKLPDAFVIFVNLESGKECVAVIEFDSTIDANYIVNDGADDEYHTTITIFEPDVTRYGKPYDYYDYLIHKHGNYEIDIVEKNSYPKTAYGENLTTVSEQEFSDETVPQPEPVVKKISATDSDGNRLSAGQQEYFADSQERDTDGNLRVMYRGDSEEVTVFDRKKSKASNLYGRGFYYTSEKSHAGQYGIVRAFYLNTVNPLIPNQHKITKDQMLRFLEAIENDGEDYDLYNYGQDATAKSVLDSIWGKGDFEMLQDISDTLLAILLLSTGKPVKVSIT